jgi:hypothetical protein
MVIKISAFEMLGEADRYKNFFETSLGFSACSPASDLAAAVFPPLGLAALTQRAKSG